MMSPEFGVSKENGGRDSYHVSSHWPRPDANVAEARIALDGAGRAKSPRRIVHQSDIHVGVLRPILEGAQQFELGIVRAKRIEQSRQIAGDPRDQGPLGRETQRQMAAVDPRLAKYRWCGTIFELLNLQRGGRQASHVIPASVPGVDDNTV